MSNNTRVQERNRESESKTSIGQYRQLSHSVGICCPNCNKTVDQRFELCPNCGYRLHNTHCTYCGAPMSSEDLFCGECGGDSKGTPCPVCGTLSFRSFCPKCNSPVDELGKEEIEKAKSDPLYRKICILAEKIITAQETGALKGNSSKTELSPEIMALLKRYRELQNGETEINSISPHSDINDSENKILSKNFDDYDNGIRFTDAADTLPDIASSIEELNALYRSMIPDPGLTPQMQRNYFSARKVAVYRKSIVQEKVGWVCNLCGCHHGSPSECARPELGGTWIYQNKEITTKTYE